MGTGSWKRPSAGDDAELHAGLEVALDTGEASEYRHSLATPTAGLWMTTEQDVGSPSGANGLDSWTGGEVLDFTDPNLALEPGTTDGTFVSAFNLDDFVQDGDARVDAIHYVSTNMTVGSNSIAVQQGDVLVSTVNTETFVNSDTSTVTANSNEVVIFRPDSVGDYSLGGTFIPLINGWDLGSIEIEGITLVETATTVGVGGGATTLNPGDFLLTDRGDPGKIFRLEPGVLGDGGHQHRDGHPAGRRKGYWRQPRNPRGRADRVRCRRRRPHADQRTDPGLNLQ